MKKKLNTEAELVYKVTKGFAKFFGDLKGTKTFLSPASVILLGDHTQYNDGIMISTTVDSYIAFCIRKTEGKFSVAIGDHQYEAEKLNELKIDSEEYIRTGLGNLIKNLAEEEFELSGFECFIAIDSSKVFGLGNFAAMNVGFLKALISVENLNLTNQKLVEIASESDKQLYGLVVSKPLYYSVLSQRENTLMYYDNRSDYKKFFTIDEKYKISVCNTNVLKENLSEKCQERIQECEVGVKGLRLYIWGIKNLRDVEEKFLERHIHMLPKRLYMRCLYNVHARKLVEEAYKNLRDDQFEEFGQKLFETHKKLDEEYNISSDTMNKLVEFGEDSNLSIGSKMVSCSYHDSTLNFVLKKNIDKFKEYITKYYSLNNGSKLEITSYSISQGVKEIKQKRKSATT